MLVAISCYFKEPPPDLSLISPAFYYYSAIRRPRSSLTIKSFLDIFYFKFYKAHRLLERGWALNPSNDRHLTSERPYRPLVSIGLPVFNGENFIEAAVDSILKQTLTDFELIIADNASTDRTQAICESFAGSDNRVVYRRNAKNIGAAKNFNLVFKLSSGTFFKWAAHDDLLDPNFLAKCVAAIDEEPSIVLSFSRVINIDEQGRKLGRYPDQLGRVMSHSTQERFKNLILNDQWCFEVFGLIRSDALARTNLIGSFVSSDAVLRAELGLLGRFRIIQEDLFFNRDHPQRSIRSLQGHHQRATWFDPLNHRRIQLPQWRVLDEYYRCIQRSPLVPEVRRRCYLTLLQWVLTNWNWLMLLSNFLLVVAPRSWSLVWRFKQLKRKFFRSRNEYQLFKYYK